MSIKDILNFGALRESGFDPTVTHFKGVCEGIDIVEEQDPNRPNESRIRTIWKFNDIEVLPGGSTEPYPYPTYTITIFYRSTASAKSGWGYWINSIKDALGIPQDQELDPDTYVFGKRMEVDYQMRPMNLRDDNGRWVIQDRPVWVCVSLDGVSPGKAPMSLRKVLALEMDGLTTQEWIAKIFLRNDVKANPTLKMEIMDQHFTNALIQGGLGTVGDDDRWHIDVEAVLASDL